MRAVALGWLLVSACILYSEDEPLPGDADDDAAETDASPVDAPVDTPPDCCIDPPPDPVTGRILLYEVDQLDPESDGSLGQGLVADIEFHWPDEAPAPMIETQPGTVFGCKAWVLTRPQALAAIGLDEGTVLLGLPGLDPQPVGMCTFAPATGYQCPGATAITPGLADPGMLPDVQATTVQLLGGGGNHVPPFSGSGTDVGDDFTLPPAQLALLENLPRDGSAFTIGCDAAACNSGAILSELEIITTDAPTAGLPPTAMPLPIDRRVLIRCAVLGSPTLDVPAVVSQFLVSSSATRIQTTYRRGRFASTNATVLALIGHAISGISN